MFLDTLLKEIEPEDHPECPELTAIDPEYLPDAPARVRIARAYQRGRMARLAVLRGDESQNAGVMHFVEATLKYTRSALNVRVRGQPYFNDEAEMNQDVFIACIHLLDRETALEEKPNCCIGTQIYNHVIWGLHRLAKSSDDIETVSYEALNEEGHGLQLVSSLENTGNPVYEKQVGKLIENRYGLLSLIWIRGRYHGNSFAQMQLIMDLSDAQAATYEKFIGTIHLESEYQKKGKPGR